jgi:hypothetical protein
MTALHSRESESVCSRGMIDSGRNEKAKSGGSGWKWSAV